MKKIYIGTGINTYKYLPESSLNKCVADIDRMSQVMKRIGFQVTTLYEEQCTKSAVLSAWDKAIASVPNNEQGYVVLHQSSHGSQVPSTTEEDGADECLVMYDTQWNYDLNKWENVILDDDIEKIMHNAPSNVIIEFVFDSCHSGDMVKGIRPEIIISKRKFVYPRNYIAVKKVRTLGSGHVLFNSRHIVLSGTSSDKFSYEDNEGGILTAGLCRVIEMYLPKLPTREQAIKKIIDIVKEKGYDQLPHYECSKEAMGWCVFDSSAAMAVSPQSPHKSSWWVRLFKRIFSWMM